MKRTIPLAAPMLALALGCSPAPRDQETRTSNLTVPPTDVHRSLIVTEEAILEPTFSFKAVLDQIVALSGATTTSLDLFHQWWDTQNLGPGAPPHCDDQKTGGAPSFNGFPWMCPRQEGGQVKTNPFDPPGADNPDGYTAIALTNRFDLAPADGSNCGEYRVVFAKNSGVGGGDRNLVIFEAMLPNPRPGCGLAACRPVADFWAHLSTVESLKDRADLLRQFYFVGLPGFEPVIHPRHYGASVTGIGYGKTGGQIRANEFIEKQWMLREWRLTNDCRCGGRCSLVMRPDTVKVNPAGLLFDETSTEPRADPFQDSFIGQVSNLAINDINGFFLDVDNQVNSGQSRSQGTENDYFTQFDNGRKVDPAFDTAITARLAQIASPLTSDNVVQRALAMSCAGCHQLSNGKDLGQGLTWPRSAVFVHVKEVGGATDAGPDGERRWVISPALRDVFLPHRQKVLEGFLGNATTSSGAVCRQGETQAEIESRPTLPIVCPDPAQPSTLSNEEIARLDAMRSKSRPIGGRTVH